MNEESLQDAVSKGDRAQMVFNEPVIQDFFNSMEKTMIDGIKGSEYEDKEGRENLYRMYRVLQSFKKHFEKYIVDGKIANDMLTKLKAGAYDNL